VDVAGEYRIGGRLPGDLPGSVRSRVCEYDQPVGLWIHVRVRGDRLDRGDRVAHVDGPRE
jgi:hypothetical protein